MRWSDEQNYILFRTIFPFLNEENPFKRKNLVTVRDALVKNNHFYRPIGSIAARLSTARSILGKDLFEVWALYCWTHRF